MRNPYGIGLLKDKVDQIVHDAFALVLEHVLSIPATIHSFDTHICKFYVARFLLDSDNVTNSF